MVPPYQCLEAINRSSSDWVLFGGCGSKLVVQSSTGVASVWRPEENEEAGEPPGKKIRLSSPPDQRTTFTNLTVSHDKRHLVAVTSEDKCIRVFEIDSDNNLRQSSQRCMARRPCSVALTDDDSTILCADKFGDVYALPLIPPPEDEQNSTPASEPSKEIAQKQFAPSASVLTVHSGRNRKVLEEQIKQATKGQKKSKDPLKFKHDLLLGHVSMLTDIAFANVNGRSYIITSDRDEHIRVSRGMPQAHIIEGFCFGHEEFVSRLCLTASGHLISGGGDPYLILWNWLERRRVQKISVRDAVLAYLREQPQFASTVPEDESSFKIAVSGIWSVPHATDEDEILVACEGIPALLDIKLGSETKTEAIALDGNPLDVAFLRLTPSTFTVVISIDNIHKPGSTTERRENQRISRLQYLACSNGGWVEDAALEGELAWLGRRAPNEGGNAGGRNAGSGDEAGDSSGARRDDEKAVRDVVYGVENLRKRPGAEDQV